MQVTQESFIAWKKKKILEKKLALRKEEKKKKKEAAAGNVGGLSGRDLFNMGQARDADDEGGAEEGGDFDLAALLKARQQEDAAALAALASAGEGEGASEAPDDGGKSAMKVDENLFAMDLGDLDAAFEELLLAEDAGGGGAAAPGPAKKSAPAMGEAPPAASASAPTSSGIASGTATGDAVAVDASLFDAEDLAGLDIDGIDDAE